MTVIQMCEKQSTTNREGGKSTISDEDDAVPKFDTFSLSFASSRSNPIAYLYGVHKEDWTAHRETYDGRMERWEEMFRTEKISNDTTVPTSSATAGEVSIERDDSMRSGIGGSTVQKDDLSSITLFSQLESKEMNLDLCVACQEVKASVVFEPCQHCVVCADCFFRNKYCNKFCPLCRTDIRSTKSISAHPMFQGFMSRPKIYSAHLFM